MKVEILVNDAKPEITTYQQAIQFAGFKLLDQGLIQEAYIQACLDREINFPTGLMMESGEGLAIPHSDYNLVKENSISVVRFDKPITFGLMEDASLTVDCNILFNLAFATSNEHMSILRKLFSLLQDSSFVNQCRTFDDAATIHLMKDQLGLS